MKLRRTFLLTLLLVLSTAVTPIQRMEQQAQANQQKLELMAAQHVNAAHMEALKAQIESSIGVREQATVSSSSRDSRDTLDPRESGRVTSYRVERGGMWGPGRTRGGREGREEEKERKRERRGKKN